MPAPPIRSDSFAWVFFKDGVRSLTLLSGVEQDEIVGLLDVVHRARTLQPDDNDDLLTLLWEKDFQRVRYVFQALAGDVGYLPTASFCGRLRGDWLNMTGLACGSRFG